MSSNIKIKRLCLFCGGEFTAQTTVTKYCSQKCASKTYKKRVKEDKIDQSNVETVLRLSIPIEKIRANDYLKVSEVCALLRISRRSLYRIIKSGLLTIIKMGQKTIIAKAEVDNLITKSSVRQTNKEMDNTEETEVYSFPEILILYGVADATLHALARRKQIVKKKINGTNYVKKSEIEKILGKPKNKIQ